MSKVQIGDLTSSIMKELEDYKEVTTDKVKKAVRESAKLVKKEIEANAPRDTGDYAKSWAIQNTRETSESLHLTVHSKTKYQLAHLLEHGHALRGGGRVSAKPHIADAESKGIEMLEEKLKEEL